MLWVWIVGATAILGGATLAVERATLSICVLVFAVLPLLLTAHWHVAGLEPTLFEYAKVYSTCLGSLYTSAFRFTAFRDWQSARPIGFCILFINMVEAIVTELHSHLSLNVAAGVLLLLTQALPRLITRHSDQSLKYDLGLVWVMSYTFWNFAFIYGTGPPGEPVGQWAAFGIVHLLTPLLIMRGDAARYLQARAYSLALLMMVGVTFDREPFVYLVPGWYVSWLAQLVGAVALALALVEVGATVRARGRGKAARNLLGHLIAVRGRGE